MSTCSICLNPITDVSQSEKVSLKEDEIREQCGHIFHKKCIQKWLDRDISKGCCPLCRKKIVRTSPSCRCITITLLFATILMVDTTANMRDFSERREEWERSCDILRDSIEEDASHLDSLKTFCKRSRQPLAERDFERGYSTSTTMLEEECLLEEIKHFSFIDNVCSYAERKEDFLYEKHRLYTKSRCHRRTKGQGSRYNGR